MHLIPPPYCPSNRPFDLASVIGDPSRQRLDIFLQAVNRLPSSLHLHVWLAGTRISHPRIRSLCRQPRQTVHQLLQQTKVVVQPSRYGGLQSALEAIAAGAALILTHDNPAFEVLQPFFFKGCLPVGPDPVNLADAISQLLADDTQREKLGRAAQEIIRRHFSLDKIVRRMLSLAGIHTPSRSTLHTT